MIFEAVDLRELNEGVKKIYSDMEDAGLPAPEYEETPNTVKLILRNNIDERIAHRSDKAPDKTRHDALSGALNGALTEDESMIVALIKKHPEITQEQMSTATGFSRRKIQRIMKALSETGIIWREGLKKSGAWYAMEAPYSER